VNQTTIFLRSDNKETLGKVNIYVDASLMDDLLAYLESDRARKKKFDTTTEYIVRGIENRDIYGLEKFEDGIDVWAIKIRVRGRGEKFNDRLYCKQYIAGGVKKIVIAHIYKNKKTQHLPRSLKDLIRRVNSYEYTFEE